MQLFPRIAILALALSLGSWLFTGRAVANEIGISASVDPWYDGNHDGSPDWNPGSLTGTALYTLSVLSTSDYGADNFKITFEGDIFDLSQTANQIVVLSEGWSGSSSLNRKGTMEYILVASSEEVLGPGEAPLLVAVDYRLLFLDRFSQAWGADWAWDAGGPWRQNVWAWGYSDDGLAMGGTATVTNPEPATLFLMGSGLIGLGAVGKRLRRKGASIDPRVMVEKKTARVS